MSAYLTFSLVDNQGAIIDAGSIIGVIHPGADPGAMGSPTKPLHLLLRGGETLPGVIATTALDVMNTVESAKNAEKAAKNPRYG